MFQKYLATLLPRHRLATLPWDGLTLLLGVVEAVLLGHVGAVLVPDHVARLRRHVLALLPLHLVGGKNEALNILGGLERGCVAALGGSVSVYLSGHDTALLGGDIAADRPRA